MEVINRGDPINFLEFGSDLGRVHSGGLILHEYAHAVLENWDGCKYNEDREDVSADGICDFCLGIFPDDQRSDNDSNRLEHIPNNVNHSCPDVNIFLLVAMLVIMRIIMVVGMHERLRTFIDCVMMARRVVVGMPMLMVSILIGRARI